MNDIDAKIREALSAEDRAVLDRLGGEPSLHNMVGETFRGRHRWMTMLAWGAVLGWTIFAAVAAVHFFGSETLDARLSWGIGLVAAFIGISMLKIWYWMELNKNAVRREIKRLELQVARLAGRLEDGEAA